MEKKEITDQLSHLHKYKVLLSFGNPKRGRSQLRLANSFIKRQKADTSVTAIHLSPANELHHLKAAEYERESFTPIIKESEELNQKILTLFKASNDIDSDITEVANKGEYDLLLIGLGQSIFEGSLFGRILGFTTRLINPGKLINKVKAGESIFESSPLDERTRNILNKSKIPVGVLIDKNFSKTDKVFLPIFEENDGFLIDYAQKLINNSDSQIVILDANSKIKNSPALKERIRTIEQKAPNSISVLSEKIIDKE